MITGYMQRTAPAQYHSILIPRFPFGAKRPVMDHGYLESLHDERVTLVKSRSIEIVASNRARLENGELFPVDVIILANGFKTQQLLTPMSIEGVDGARLPEIWQQDGQAASAYMGYGLHFPRATR
jgi:cation diffusion facilitator CzcD-associated flavoprotein CzcO